VAVSRGILQCRRWPVTIYYNPARCVAVCCSALPCVAVCRGVAVLEVAHECIVTLPMISHYNPARCVVVL